MSNIVDIQTGFCRFESPIIRQVATYWQGRGRKGQLPRFSDIDPKDIAATLSHVFVLQKAEPRGVKFTIAGTRLVELMGTELRGMAATSIIEPGTRNLFAETMAKVFTGKAKAHLTARIPPSGTRGAPAGLFLAPMADETGTASRILGCLDLVHPLPAAPARLTIESSFVSALSHDGYQQPARDGGRQAACFAEAAQGFERAGLRLVRDRGKSG